MGPSKIIKNLEWLIETEMDNIEYLVEANRQGPLGYAQTRLATYQAALAVIWWETLPGACRYAASMAPQEPPISRMTGLGQ
jgi:hypothetical protein